MQRDAKMVSYKVVDKGSKPQISVNIAGETKTFSPEEVSAMILTKVRCKAERPTHLKPVDRLAAQHSSQAAAHQQGSHCRSFCSWAVMLMWQRLHVCR